MKKIFFIIIFGYLAIGAIVIFSFKEKTDVINYFSIENNYSRLLTTNEVLSIPIFFSDNKNFLIDSNNISSVSLKNDIFEVAVDIKAIKYDSTIVYLNKTYYQYSFLIEFSKITIDNLEMEMLDAKLLITYKNSEILEIEVGNLFLNFGDVQASDHIDLRYLSGIVNEIDGKKYLVGIILKVDNFTTQPIQIKSISTNVSKMAFSLERSFLSLHSYDSETDLEEIVGEFDVLVFTLNSDFQLLLNDDYYYVIPVMYQELVKINRLPIIIEYGYNNQDYRYVIDDFMFFNERFVIDDYEEYIREYQYSYKKSN